jgi:P-aminobenzoate N-oxygenase AurF
VSTYDHYTMPVERGNWEVPATGAARFSWEYEEGRQRLLDLYQRGKDKQWDATKRIDWDLPVNPTRVMETGDDLNPIYGSRQWEKLNQAERDELNIHLSSWLFSQFLHGEQGALTVAARIVESVPDMDSKFYAATQAMDEARHVELFSRFIKEKIGTYYPINTDLARLLADALGDSRWDMPYLGMQVLIEGLALAAFGVHRDITGNSLVKQLLAYVMQDEARHVAFGRLALRDYYAGLTAAERADREEFVVEGCYLMRNRFRAQEVWERMGYDVDECLEFTEHSPMQQAFRTLLFSRIVPCVRDIGLWGEKVQRAYADLGVLDAASTDLESLMRDDEDQAERIEREHAAEVAARQAEVSAAIDEGATAPDRHASKPLPAALIVCCHRIPLVIWLLCPNDGKASRIVTAPGLFHDRAGAGLGYG